MYLHLYVNIKYVLFYLNTEKGICFCELLAIH